MSHPPVTEAALGHPLVAADQPLFAPEEILQFDADDTAAGKAIGEMLSILFLYTVFAMSIATLATYTWIRNASSPTSAKMGHK